MSKKRSIQGKSNRSAVLRQPCRCYLKSTCTRSPCQYWHPPERQLYKTETGCKAGDNCLFPHHKVDEQPNKKAKERLLFTQKKRKRRQECSGCCENCTTIGLRLARLGCVGFSKRQTVPEKPAKSLGINSKSTVHSVYATSSKYPGKERTISWKNTSQKNPHQRSPYAMEFEDRSHEETERQQRCARTNARKLAKNTYKLKENGKTTFCSPRGRMGTPGRVNKRA